MFLKDNASSAAVWKGQLSKEEASILYDSGWWRDKTPEQILAVQLFERRLIMPFFEFQRTVETFFGEDLTTCAFADAGTLQKMYLKKKGEKTNVE